MFQCSIANDLFPLLWPNTNNVPALPALGSWRGALEGWFQSPHWLVLGDHAVALRALQPPSLFSWDLHPPPHDRVSGVDSFITYEIRGRPLGRNIMPDLKFGRVTVLRVCRASVVFPVHISRCRPPKSLIGRQFMMLRVHISSRLARFPLGGIRSATTVQENLIMLF